MNDLFTTPSAITYSSASYLLSFVVFLSIRTYRIRSVWLVSSPICLVSLYIYHFTFLNCLYESKFRSGSPGTFGQVRLTFKTFILKCHWHYYSLYSCVCFFTEPTAFSYQSL